MKLRMITTSALMSITWATCASGQSVMLAPAADVTIHAASNGIDEAANGAGPWNFTGWTTRFSERRTLLRFDIAASVPANAVITSAALTVRVDRGIADGNLFGLHRVTAAWHEGPALPEEPGGEGTEPQAGDVTWSFRAFGTTPTNGAAWSTAGGDFVPQASSQTALSRTGAFTFASTPQMVGDVTAWLQDPAMNHGWIVVATDPMFSGSAKRLASREAPDVASRPTLHITYSVCGDLDFNNDGVFPDDRDLADLLGVLAGEECAACDSIDFNADGVFPDDRDITAFINVLAGGACE